MGVVYKARQLTLNRLVALKMIRNAEFASEDQVRRFQNEAEAVATLDHPGIVPIYKVGTYEDQRYFSMKLVEGQGLDKKLKELANDPWAPARVVAEVADAVNHAHQRGIIPPAHAEQIQTALVKAVAAVRTAVGEGFRDRVYLETEPDLDPIRNRDDFKQILGDIRPS
jgi:imidazolonepropionase-like amidohydrolase